MHNYCSSHIEDTSKRELATLLFGEKARKEKHGYWTDDKAKEGDEEDDSGSDESGPGSDEDSDEDDVDGRLPALYL
jgi:hypothetical protein